jgi:hypothetical protein
MPRGRAVIVSSISNRYSLMHVGAYLKLGHRSNWFLRRITSVLARAWRLVWVRSPGRGNLYSTRHPTQDSPGSPTDAADDTRTAASQVQPVDDVGGRVGNLAGLGDREKVWAASAVRASCLLCVARRDCMSWTIGWWWVSGWVGDRSA